MRTKTPLGGVALATVVALALLLVGCRTAPVYNVTDAPVNSSSGSPTLEDMSQAITKAGVGLGWQMKPVEPGYTIGTLYLRSHMAQVDIKYNAQSYSITYKDSSDLNYDGEVIHKNYNGWIQNLDNRIRAELSAL